MCLMDQDQSTDVPGRRRAGGWPWEAATATREGPLPLRLPFPGEKKVLM